MTMSIRMSEMGAEAKVCRKDRIILNVGGVRHETFKSTLRNFPDTRLAWITGRDNMSDYYDEEKDEYFFDRHPGVFQQIMNFYRTGKLHCPSDVCGPLFEDELNYWGIDEKQMEPCCWCNYTLHREAQENLEVFNGPEFEDADDEPTENADEWDANNEHRTSNTPKWQRWRSNIWSVFDDHTSSTFAKVYIWVSLAFVVVSVLSLCAATDQNVGENDVVIKVIDTVCGIWFTAEFLLRCATCPDFVEFLKQIINWVDFIAVIPFYLQQVFGSSIIIDILMLVRMLRLFRFFKMSLGLQILKHTLVASFKEVVLLCLLVLIPVLIFAGILHLCEKNVSETKFKSIPEALWWAIITVTTVGYGDMAPLTTQGKIFGSICAAVSLLISAFPISIIGANFSLYYRHAQAKLKLPKKPRKLLFGADNALVRDDRSGEKSNEDDKISLDGGNGTDDLTGDVYLGPRRPRVRMSLFANGVAPQRNSRIRSASSDLLPERTNDDDDEDDDDDDDENHNDGHQIKKKQTDNHKSSLLSTSTKSTTIDSPPPRSVSFPANLHSVDRCTVIDETMGSADNHAFNNDKEHSRCNGKNIHSHSAGSHRDTSCGYGSINPLVTPQVTITTDWAKDSPRNNQDKTSCNETEGITEVLQVHDIHKLQSPTVSTEDALPSIDG